MANLASRADVHGARSDEHIDMDTYDNPLVQSSNKPQVLSVGDAGFMKELSMSLPADYKTLTIQATEAQSTEEDEHKLHIDDLAHRFNTSTTAGLTSAEASARLGRDGPNTMSAPPPNWIKNLINYLFGGFCWLLWIAAIITFISWQPLGQPPAVANLALAILLIIVIFVNAIFTAWQDWTSSRIMSKINSMLPKTATIVRDNKMQNVALSTVVKGDLVTIKYGNKVPADLRLISLSGLKVDNSILTGESIPVTCTVEATDPSFHESRNIVLMGTLVTEGEGVGIVIATGDRTMMGKVAKLANTSKTKSTILQREIQKFVLIIASFAIVTAVGCMIIWAAWLRSSYPNFLNLSNMLATDMGVIVAYVPEGLPIAVTLVLTIIARRMRLKRILVKSLTTVETLGCVNVLLSDKTGTLTTNQMTVANVSIYDRDKEVGYGPQDHDTKKATPAELQLIKTANLCNGASFESEDMHLPIMSRRINGDATDSALLKYAFTVENGEESRLEYPRVHVVPFNSKNKWMLTIVKPTMANSNVFAPGSTGLVLLIKGAPDVLFPSCTTYLSSDDKSTAYEFDTAAKTAFLNVQERWAGSGQRVLLLGRRLLSAEEYPEGSTLDDAKVAELVHDICIIGLVGIVDPPRPETAGVVATARAAGIRLCMVTGDHHITAAAIARKVGIITSSNCDGYGDVTARSKDLAHLDEDHVHSTALLLTGADITRLESVHWDVVERYREIVFARTTPEQKLKVVKSFQERGNIVAVTGDGVNDAPALKNSDIGIAMGSGSEVAMEAGAMVLLDSNFSSIIVAMREGRTVFDNLKKVCLYLLPAGSFSELTPVLVNLFLGVPAPLSGFLMIFICVVTDVGPAMALMYEEGESDLLTRPPRRPKIDSLVNSRLLLHAYLFIGFIESFFAHLMYFLYMKWEWGVEASSLLLAFDQWGSDGYAGLSAADQATANATGQCVYFITLVMMQIFGNLYATRTRKLSVFQQSPWKNKRLFLAMLWSITLAAIIVYFGKSFLGNINVPAKYWFIPIPMGLLVLSIDEVRKLIVRNFPASIFAKIAW